MFIVHYKKGQRHSGSFKGTVPRDFWLLVLFMNQFPPSPWVYHLGCFKFFQKFAKIFAGQGAPSVFNQNNVNSFVWTPLGSRVNIYIIFCLQVHVKVSAAWYCSHYLPPVSLIPLAICYWRCWQWRQICHRYCWHQWQICETGGKFATRVSDTGGATWLGISANFRRNFKWP